MSVNEKQTEQLEEEVVVNECCEATDLVVSEEETKKAKIVSIAKKVGKVALVAGVGILGFALGRKTASKDDEDYEDDSEVIDVEYETEEE